MTGFRRAASSTTFTGATPGGSARRPKVCTVGGFPYLTTKLPNAVVGPPFSFTRKRICSGSLLSIEQHIESARLPAERHHAVYGLRRINGLYVCLYLCGVAAVNGIQPSLQNMSGRRIRRRLGDCVS